MKRFFINQDSFLEIPSFRVKGEDGYKTLTGGILYVVYLFFYMSISMYYLINNFSNYQPIISTYSTSTNFGNEIILNHENIQLALSFYEEKESILPVTFDISSEITHKKIDVINNIFNEVSIGEAIKCKDLETIILSQNKNNKLENKDLQLLPFYQLKKHLNVLEDNTYCNYFKQNLIYGGDLLSTGLKNVLENEIIIDACSIKGITKEDCNNIQKLSTFSNLNNFNWIFLFKNFELNPNLDLGYNAFTESLQNEFDLGMDHIITFTYVKNILTTDNNFIFDFIKPKIITFPSFIINHLKVPRVGNSNEVKLIISFEQSSYDINHDRGYIRLDSILANIQAVVSIFEIFILYLGKLLNYGKLDVYIANKSYNVVNNNKKIKNSLKIKNSIKDIIKNNLLNKDNSKVISLKNNSNSNYVNENLDKDNDFKMLKLSNNSDRGNDNLNNSILNIKKEIISSSDNKIIDIKRFENVNSIANKDVVYSSINKNDILKINKEFNNKKQKDTLNLNNYIIKNNSTNNFSNSKRKPLNEINLNIIEYSPKNNNSIDKININNNNNLIKLNPSRLEIFISEFKFLEYLCYMNKARYSKEKKKFDVAKTYLDYDLDIITYFKKMQQIEVLIKHLNNTNILNASNLYTERIVSCDLDLRKLQDEYCVD